MEKTDAKTKCPTSCLVEHFRKYEEQRVEQHLKIWWRGWWILLTFFSGPKNFVFIGVLMSCAACHRMGFFVIPSKCFVTGIISRVEVEKSYEFWGVGSYSHHEYEPHRIQLGSHTVTDLPVGNTSLLTLGIFHGISQASLHALMPHQIHLFSWEKTCPFSF